MVSVSRAIDSSAFIPVTQINANWVANIPFGNINDWMDHLNASDKSPNINVAECNQIIKNLGLKTYEGKYKIQIVWAAKYLGKEGNRLLKLIEEPTPDTIIILVEDNRNAILNTIRSRCQIISVPPFEDNEISQLLEENGASLSQTDKQELTYLSSGNMRKALQMIGQAEMNYSEDILNWFLKNNPIRQNNIFEYYMFKSSRFRHN